MSTKPSRADLMKTFHEARIRKALDDELAPYGLTFDSPRELWPEWTVIRASQRMKREMARPS